MFYQEETDSALRFGDVLKGIILTTPEINEPDSTKPDKKYSINIDLPVFSVVLSPCCSISDKIISLTPLVELRGSFFNNPFFTEDLTRINREMEPEQAVPVEVWKGLPPKEKQKRLEKGVGYAFIECFIYEKNNLFPKYTINRKNGNVETNYYMIDFRNTYRLNCEKIISPKNCPYELKRLQLSVKIRAELREKISKYFSRPPEEDQALLEY
jgi:hypothetical protein